MRLGGAVEARDLLRAQPHALHELDVAERLGRRAGEGRRLRDDHLLHPLDPPRQRRAQPAEQGDGGEVDRRDQPVDGEGVHHDEHDADDRLEEDVDGGGDQLLDVGAHLLQLAERLAAALVLEELVGKVERVPDAVRVQLGPDPLRHDVHEVVLEVLGHAGDERHADGGEQQEGDAAEELAGRVLVEACGVLVDDVPEDEGVEEREDLVDGGEEQGQEDEPPVGPEVRQQEVHGARPQDSRRGAARRREAAPGGGGVVRVKPGAARPPPGRSRPGAARSPRASRRSTARRTTCRSGRGRRG